MTDLLWLPGKETGMYANPILFADYSDPDVIRFGDYFYLTASSFQYTPGLPILRSTNLVDWELLTYALPRIPQERYALPQLSQGVWAPSMRVHDGHVWIFYGMPDEGIFAVQAEQPEGPWSEPILIREGKGLIDPCPHWDKAGNAWVVHAYAKSRIGFKSVLGCFQFMAAGQPMEGVDRLIFDGEATQLTIEGPKVHERNGYLYIFAPAGGVKTGWQTVLRGRSVWGPFEERVVMDQGSTEINGPHQGAWVEGYAGEDWFVHFQDRGAYGRITHLQPMRWENDWPIIGNAAPGATRGEPVLVHALPSARLPQLQPLSLQASDPFAGDELGLQWQWYGNPPKQAWSFDGGLRLAAQNADRNPAFSLWNKPNVLTQKLICPACEVAVDLDAQALADGNTAGLALLGAAYMALRVRREAGVCTLELVQAAEAGAEELLQTLELKEPACRLSLRIVEVDGQPLARFGYTACGEEHYFDETFVPRENTWTGVKPALFAISREGAAEGSALFSDFRVCGAEVTK